MGIVGDFLGFGLGIMNYSNQAAQQYRNAQDIAWQKRFAQSQFDWQKDWAEKQFNYQQELNNLTMQREDNAIQRRAADLSAAGLNPNLAVGQAASSQGYGTAGSTGVVGSNLAARQTAKMDVGALMDLSMRRAQVNQIQEQASLLKSQQKYYDALSGKVNAETSNVEENTELVKNRNEQLLFDLGLSKLVRVRTNDTGSYSQAATSVIGSTVDVAKLIAGEVVNAVAPKDEDPSVVQKVVDSVSSYVKSGLENDKIKIEQLGDSIKSGVKKGWSWLKKVGEGAANFFDDFFLTHIDKPMD